MSTRNEETLPATRPRSRKSLSALPLSTLDKENITADLGAIASHKRTSRIEKPIKKLRSKSIGPGGLDALTNRIENGQETQTLIAPRSILKPTMPPLREIPIHRLQRSSPNKSRSLASPSRSKVVPKSVESAPAVVTNDVSAASSSHDQAGPQHETKVNLRTEEEQQLALQQREEQEKKASEKEIHARREARRKSLANRRVSFAPEATLHTWDVVEYAQDSTTSSSATNLTRRESMANSTPSQTDPMQNMSQPPSNTYDHVPDSMGEESELPYVKPQSQQNKGRRSSGIPPLNFNNPDDEFLSSSPFSGSSALGEEDVDFEDDPSSDSDSDLDDGTAMSLDNGDTTNMSIASDASPSSEGSSVRLEEALRLASRQAGTRGIDFDENGVNIAEDEEDEEDIISFKPWSKSQDTALDKENLNPFSPAFKASAAQYQHNDEDDDADMEMDMTRAVGGILPTQSFDAEDEEMTMDMTVAMGSIFPGQSAHSKSQRSVDTQSLINRVQSHTAGIQEEDATMDFTMAVGGIRPSATVTDPQTDDASAHEDMTMDFTSVVGGVMRPNPRVSDTEIDEVVYPQLDNVTPTREASVQNSSPMDITMAIGSVLPNPQDPTDNDAHEDETMNMEMTTAIGKILPQEESLRSQSQTMVEKQTDELKTLRTPSKEDEASPSIHRQSTVVGEHGSPMPGPFVGRGLRRSIDPGNSSARKQSSSSVTRTPPSISPRKSAPSPARVLSSRRSSSPLKGVNVPSVTPTKSSTTTKDLSKTNTPQSKRALRSSTSTTTSPTRVPSSSKPRPIQKPTTPNKLFQSHATTGIATPNFILAPSNRKLSGVGIDREGLGSPRLSAILDRRSSIGLMSQPFSPGLFDLTNPGVRFDISIGAEDGSAKQRESGRKIMELEADADLTDRDITSNLKEMIESLSPKKKSMKPRKSLHVGAAKGVLGKRPAELDDSDDDSISGVKRLKDYHGSPVKNVKLQQPPTKEETTGRLNHAMSVTSVALDGKAETPIMSESPVKNTQATTPKSIGKFKNIPVEHSSLKPISFEGFDPLSQPEAVPGKDIPEEEPMQLQDFLNMTSIRFMELNTTKRRHTIAPKDLHADGKNEREISLEDCVIAGACTVPMLELFQHSCRELKKYISEGRSVVREIETETFEENPALFREYVSAAPDIKIMMDNQFKNVKTHARLTSKGQWYDWRMQLLNGLKTGLVRTMDEMSSDQTNLDQQLNLLTSVVPDLVKEHERCTQGAEELQAAALELADCDQETLRESREQLVTFDQDIEAKKRKIAALKAQVQEKEASVKKLSERRQVCIEEIQEAEKTREECRGWTSEEVMTLKSKVDELEVQYGWTITGISESTISMAYRSELELVFDSSSFKGRVNAASTKEPRTNTRIDLWYIGQSEKANMSMPSVERDFSLDNIRDHARGLVQHETSIKSLLETVSTSWQKAVRLHQQIRTLNIEYPTVIERKSDNSIVVITTMLLKSIATKLRLEFEMTAVSGSTFELFVRNNVHVVYGSGFNKEKLMEFLDKRIKADANGKGWMEILMELGEKLSIRGGGGK